MIWLSSKAVRLLEITDTEIHEEEHAWTYYLQERGESHSFFGTCNQVHGGGSLDELLAQAKETREMVRKADQLLNRLKQHSRVAETPAKPSSSVKETLRLVQRASRSPIHRFLTPFDIKVARPRIYYRTSTVPDPSLPLNKVDSQLNREVLSLLRSVQGRFELPSKNQVSGSAYVADPLAVQKATQLSLETLRDESPWVSYTIHSSPPETDDISFYEATLKRYPSRGIGINVKLKNDLNQKSVQIIPPYIKVEFYFSETFPKKNTKLELLFYDEPSVRAFKEAFLANPEEKPDYRSPANPHLLEAIKTHAIPRLRHLHRVASSQVEALHEVPNLDSTLRYPEFLTTEKAILLLSEVRAAVYKYAQSYFIEAM